MEGRDKKGRYIPGSTVAGKNRKYQTPQELADKIEEYFVSLEPTWDEENEKWIPPSKNPTLNGLATYLEFYDKSALDTYGNDPAFSPLLKRAKMLIEDGYEQRLFGNSPTGAIFALKNFGWIDKTQHEEVGNTNKPDYSSLTLEERIELLNLMRKAKGNPE